MEDVQGFLSDIRAVQKTETKYTGTDTLVYMKQLLLSSYGIHFIYQQPSVF